MGRISFDQLCIATAAIWAILALTLQLWPAVIHWLFAISSDVSTDTMSRRAGVLFAGLATIVWSIRNASDSAVRRSVCLGFLVAMGGMASLGMIEFMRGVVGIGIWIAIVVELGFAGLYFHFWQGGAQK